MPESSGEGLRGCVLSTRAPSFLRRIVFVCSNDHAARACRGRGGDLSRSPPLAGRVDSIDPQPENPAMRRPTFPVATIAPAIVLLAIPAWSAAARAASPFPDKNLEAAIRDVLKHEPKVELTDEKLQNVYFLEATGKDIKDLTGLEKCKNLAELKLAKNKISDIKALKDLTNLQSLDLSDNAIKDIGPLANLKGLQYIELSGNQVEKLEPLVRPDQPDVAVPGQERDQGHRAAGPLDQAMDAVESPRIRSRTSRSWRSSPSSRRST